MASSIQDVGFAAFVILIITIAIICYKKATSKSSPPLPPGPKGLPIVGYLPFLGPNLHHELTKMGHQYGPIFKLYLGSKLHIVFNSAKLAKVVTGEKDETFANRAPHIAGLATSYNANDVAFAPNNANSRNLRKVLVHEVLSNVNLEASHIYRVQEVKKMMEKVHDTMGAPVNINDIAFTTVLNILTNIIWGKSLLQGTKLDKLSEDIRKVVSRIVEIAEGLNVSDFFPALAMFDLQGVEKRMKNQMKQFDQIIERSIEERINTKFTDSNETKKDFLQVLLDNKDQNTPTSINITQLKALTVDTFLGGTDATSAMVEWAMTEILRNQKVTKKVQEELQQVVGLNNNVEESHLPKLKYLDAVFKETFRLHTPLPFLLPRVPNKSCTVAGYTVPQDSTILLNVYAIQRDPQYWNDPLEFKPERFLKNQGLERFDYSGTNFKYIPFGSGRRRCPGVPLGEKTMMHILASLMHSFEWNLPKGEKHDFSEKFGIAMKKQNPLVVVASRR